MHQDYREITPDQLEDIERQTLRTIVQAIQEYSKESKEIFDNTDATSDNEVIVLAEDLVQYALEVAESYPINKRYAGFIDYKRVRWCPTPFGLIPQVLLVDAKASTENNRETLQQSQLPMDAEFRDTNGVVHTLSSGVAPHLDIETNAGGVISAVTTSIFIHYHYKKLNRSSPPYRDLKSIYVLSIPHALLKTRYNPDPDTTFFGQGKHSPSRNEAKRIRVYFSRLRSMARWRLQQLSYVAGSAYTIPLWFDDDVPEGTEFKFIGR